MEALNPINAILLDNRDNVVTITIGLSKGESVGFERDGSIYHLKVIQDVPIYHKVAIHPIKLAEPIYKYGEIIGWATQDIQIGEHVHTQNLSSEKE